MAMLNPCAHEFTPVSVSPSFKERKATTNENNSERKGKGKEKEGGKEEIKARNHTPTVRTNNGKLSAHTKGTPHQVKVATTRGNKQKTPLNHNEATLKAPHTPNTRPLSAITTTVQKQSKQTHTVSNMLETPSKFITIEAMIDPLFYNRPDKEESPNTSGSSTANVTRLEHGYERYIHWIGTSLKAFNSITLVGIENAVVNVISLVAILQQRGIGEHEEIETFSMKEGKRWKNGIQVRLHRLEC
ncbi:hypothetical protein BDF14DRAFT_1756084 [Spinellus fusiger]|nr:hypothetical protein BDF14DRAFT_1756084 [Spinellus fusiger]